MKQKIVRSLERKDNVLGSTNKEIHRDLFNFDQITAEVNKSVVEEEKIFFFLHMIVFNIC